MRRVSGGRARDSVAAGFAAVAGILALGAMGFRPFALEPAAALLVLAATIMTDRHKKLITISTIAVGFGFVIGASIAVAGSHPLY